MGRAAKPGPADLPYKFQLQRLRIDAGGYDQGGAYVECVAADYRPGQYAVLELAPGLRRCLSMAGPPGEDQVEFIAKCYPGGEGSQRLFALHRGDQIPVELPYGDMWLRPAE